MWFRSLFNSRDLVEGWCIGLPQICAKSQYRECSQWRPRRPPRRHLGRLTDADDRSPYRNRPIAWPPGRPRPRASAMLRHACGYALADKSADFRVMQDHLGHKNPPTPPAPTPSGQNERWSLDFVSDSFTDGPRFRVLAVVDDFMRESSALIPDTSLSGARVAREIDALLSRRGRPKTCISDNGTELTSMVMLQWMQTRGVVWHYIARAVARRVPKQDAVLLALPGPRRTRLVASRL
jgi:hypothetical protein